MSARQIRAGLGLESSPRGGRVPAWRKAVAVVACAAASSQAVQAGWPGDGPLVQPPPRVRQALDAGGDASHAAPSSAAAPILAARGLVADCQKRFEAVEDYTCTFYKRELVKGKMTPLYQIAMKVRTKPFSVYMKFHNPKAGREAIYVQGANNNKVVAHDVGVAKVLAGTLRLNPREKMAMEDNRHPITEAGIGHLIETLVDRWAVELQPGESQVTIDTHHVWGNRPCTLIVSTHPEKRPEFLFHEVKVYIDHELGLPVRFEAYDWPHDASGRPVLVEEYSYQDLIINVGLDHADFSDGNKAYSFGRF